MSTPGRVLIFANPLAGRGRGAALTKALADALAPSHDVRVFTAPAGSLRADQLAVSPQSDCAVVVGGDGTLRSVVWAYQTHKLDIPPLLPVPMGTANLMGRYLGMWPRPTTISQILQTIARRVVVSLDAASANGAPCLLIASAGFDAAVVHDLARRRSGPIQMWDYVPPAIRTMRAYSFPPIDVEADGEMIFCGRPGLAFVANVPQYGLGIPIVPDARPDDGMLDVAAFPCATPLELIELMMRIVAGDQLLIEGAVHRKATSVKISSRAPLPVQVDGEAAGFAPLSIQLMPHWLPFLLPVHP